MPEVWFPALHMPEGDAGAVLRAVKRLLLAAGVTLLLVALVPAGLLALLAVLDVVNDLKR